MKTINIEAINVEYTTPTQPNNFIRIRLSGMFNIASTEYVHVINFAYPVGTIIPWSIVAAETFNMKIIKHNGNNSKKVELI